MTARAKRKIIDSMRKSDFIEIYRKDSLSARLKETGEGVTVLSGAAGSSLSLYVAAAALETGGVHVVVADDKDSAGFIYYDLLNFIDSDKLFFFPTSYKRSSLFGTESNSNIVQRTAFLGALSSIGDGDTAVVCTYPEALAEKVASAVEMQRQKVTLSKGDKIAPAVLVERLVEMGFERGDFVWSPGQYSLRGGIVDIFSYGDTHPYRVDFFGDEIDSIRVFDINTQLSVENLDRVDVMANMSIGSGRNVSYVSLAELLKDKSSRRYWVVTPRLVEERMNQVCAQALATTDDKVNRPSDAVCDGRAFVESLKGERVVSMHGTFSSLEKSGEIIAAKSPQPAIGKNFELLRDDLAARKNDGFRTFIATENKAQIERLSGIMASIGGGERLFESVDVTLKEGFVDSDNRVAVYTDHQIFERNHRYRLMRELPKAEGLSVSELQEMSPGDYIVHIDHGIGRYGGLTRSMENGKMTESVKIVYKDGDVLLVGVHALHKISKYKDGDTIVAPKLHKLGGGAWQRQKAVAKSHVKDIAKDLIALYAKRKASAGFAFSPDGYMQQELEASFLYEDTPDQQKATEALKRDMESPVPMDRLVCGDVGFGKTEIAIRAALKAAADGKQVAVLVPTTVLSLQHYHTFTRRLANLPVTVENLSRAKSGAQTTDILKRLKEGKIDIIIGTHKLLGGKVEFKDLGLLIIDEEQKFGVSSKEKLRKMRESIDTLTLTATPIPRTLQFSLMGARDLSIIATPPANRQPVSTEVHEFSRELIKEAIESEISRGGQCFVVHNKIETISRIASMIQEDLPNARIAIGHGQMPPAQLEKIMTDFIYGEYDVLVATTIIESGIDIQNANTIIVNDAQNFGLGDLHQLRGRVGRNNRKAYCLLLTPPVETISETARRRLRAIEEFSDLGSGFNIAMQDLDIRGAGNMLGAEQSGFIADIGFETYKKILDEAMIELKAEGYGTELPAENLPERSLYVSDCQIDIDDEAFIPDDYVSNTAEKIKLYRTIDSIETQEEARKTAAELTDRFGPMPESVKRLLAVVALRKKAMSLGFEKAIVKNGFFILHFVGKPQSPYFKSDLFASIMEFVASCGDGFKVKQSTERLLLSIRGVNGIDEALGILERMERYANDKKEGHGSTYGKTDGEKNDEKKADGKPKAAKDEKRAIKKSK